MRNLPKLVLLVALALTGGGASPGNGGMATSTPNLPPSALLPASVTDLSVSAVTDTSAVLTWTEVPSNNTAVARYLVRYAFYADPLPPAPPFLTTGGCGAPIYGSTTAGGRVRSCVLGGLKPQTRYAFEVIAFTGTLTTTGNFSPRWSNRVEATTAVRMAQLLVSRPPMFLDTVQVAAVSVQDYGATRFPLRGRFWLGDRIVQFYDSTGAVVANGYMLVTKP